MQKGILLFLSLFFVSCLDSKKETEPEVKTEEGKALVLEVPNLEKTTSSEIEISSPSPLSILATRNILNKIEILMPRSFKIMSAEMMAVKYPLKEESVFQVFTDEDAAVNMAFEHTTSKVKAIELPMIKQAFEQQFLQSGINLEKSQIQNVNKIDFIVLEMTTPTMDVAVYNLMYITTLDNRLFIATFNCTVDRLNEWKPLAVEIMNSLKFKGTS